VSKDDSDLQTSDRARVGYMGSQLKKTQKPGEIAMSEFEIFTMVFCLPVLVPVG